MIHVADEPFFENVFLPGLEDALLPSPWLAPSILVFDLHLSSG